MSFWRWSGDVRVSNLDKVAFAFFLNALWVDMSLWRSSTLMSVAVTLDWILSIREDWDVWDRSKAANLETNWDRMSSVWESQRSRGGHKEMGFWDYTVRFLVKLSR